MHRPTTADVLQFWGKARAPEDSAVAWHPVAYHLLDVAAVVDALLVGRPQTRQRAAWLLGTSEDAARQLLVALASLHDLGKFAPRFQSMATPENWTWPTVLSGVDASRYETSRHTLDGLNLWNKRLRSLLIERISVSGGTGMMELECAVFGHHGRPINLADAAPLWGVFCDGAAEAALCCAHLVLDQVLAEPIATQLADKKKLRLASWWVAGLFTLCDWVGSSSVWFPYVAPLSNDDGLSNYWQYAQARAKLAVAAAGLLSMPSAALLSFEALTSKATPTPTQTWAATVLLPAEPMLAIIEDATGSGKTEAAQMLVHRLMADGRASGAYWAMPTQATANAMYARQRKMISALFAPSNGRKPSLTLGHGQATLHESYQSTVLHDVADVPDPTERTDGNDGSDSASVACASFLADDRRKSLLADIGAGTVDQALLGVLPTRFNTLRLFALAEKVLVLDEVHAFDAYMSGEALQLLRFHAALGGSAVLLSATLPEKRRRELERAWQYGRSGADESPVDDDGNAATKDNMAAYPLATLIAAGRNQPVASALDAAEWTVRTVKIRPVRALDQALEYVMGASSAGGAVVWIRNTVDECLRAVAMLKARGCSPIVFHARFAQGDRQRREREVLEWFGEKSGPETRAGKILVATQVVEQSLDLDFDAMVTDLAPIDLLIQRAGRLWRHDFRNSVRPIAAPPELVVLTPDVTEPPSPDWSNALLPGTRYVYPHLGVLWRTAKVLDEQRVIQSPQNLRALIHRAYVEEDVPENLQRATNVAEGDEVADRAIAEYSVLDLPKGYAAGRAWTDDLHARTRLGEEQVVVRLARADGNSIAPWYTETSMQDEWKRWPLSEVKLSGKRVARNAAPIPRWRAAVDSVRQTWGRYEQDVPVIVLEQAQNGHWSGSITAKNGKHDLQVVYSAERGLEYVQA